ncbi:MAG: hypothetical protein ABI120_26020 [Gemmatimonadaceae bacterium]
MTKPTPLRIGLMLDSLVVPAWLAALLRDIQLDDCAEIVLVVMHDTTSAGAVAASAIRPGVIGKLSRLLSGKTQVNRYLYQKYTEWDEAHARLEPDPHQNVDMTIELGGIERRNVVPITDRFIHRFQEADIAHIRAANLDVLLRFGFNIIKGPILESARYGVWSFHHGDNQQIRGGPAYFWELYFDQPLSGIVLQVLSEKLDAGRILYRSYASTERGSSMRMNGARSFWKGSSFLIRRLRQLHTHGWEWMQRELPTFREDPKQQGRIFRLPTNGKMVRFAAATVGRNLRKRVRNFGKMEHWFVVYRSHHEGLRSTGPGPAAPFTELVSPKNHYYADPFLVERDGRSFLFFEDFLYKANRGIIAYVELQADGSVTPARTVLDLPYHLSYPFVFEHDGAMYMIPESASNKSVDLYRASSFPDTWEHVKSLQTGVRAYDVTLYVRDGVYWFFANIVERGTHSSDELFLFSADSLTGDWTPHPMNPIVSDVRRSRPAGKLFERDGRLMRPSQDCSLSYGGAMQLNEILVLSKTHYEEHPVSRIDPDWAPGLVGTHTLNSSEHFETMDGRKLLPVSSVLSG